MAGYVPELLRSAVDTLINTGLQAGEFMLRMDTSCFKRLTLANDESR
jgi:hypothetical protein